MSNEELKAVLHSDFYVEFRDVTKEPAQDDVERLDSLLDALGLERLGADWQAIDLEQAKLLLDDVLGEDLMGGFRVRHDLPPEQILARFLGNFDLPQARFYTNVKVWNEDDASSWTPFTKGGLCVTVACCDGQRVGMLWTDQ
jgi:hypothetical protein